MIGDWPEKTKLRQDKLLDASKEGPETDGTNPAPEEPDPFRLSRESASLSQGGRAAVGVLRNLDPEIRLLVQHQAGCHNEENLRLLRALVSASDASDDGRIHVKEWTVGRQGFAYGANRINDLARAHLLHNPDPGKGFYLPSQLGRYVAAWSALTDKQRESLSGPELDELYRP